PTTISTARARTAPATPRSPRARAATISFAPTTASSSGSPPTTEMNLPAVRLDAQMFSSKVARRAFVAFIACALLPVFALAILAFQQVTSQLQEQGQRRLQQASKQVAMVLLKRLLAAEAALGQPAEPKPADRLGRPLSAALWTGAEGSERLVSGAMSRPRLTEDQLTKIAAGRTVLSIEREGRDQVRFVVSRAVDAAAPDRGIVHG